MVKKLAGLMMGTLMNWEHKFLPNQCIVGFRAKEWADPSIINQFI
jgi:hypothetical protein